MFYSIFACESTPPPQFQDEFDSMFREFSDLSNNISESLRKWQIGR